MTDATASQTFAAQLDSVKNKLIANQTAAATSDLETFINEVENRKDTGLMPEGYALLKFNAIHLRDRLAGH